ncbi:MAG: hypothetical protein Q9169_001223 [Polycauliona sp. 2 TL-2023]
MHAVLVVVLLASLNAFVAASPMPQEATPAAIASEPEPTILKRRSTHNCNQDENLKKIEAQAWADAGALANLASEYDYDNEWQPAMDLWMGVDCKELASFYKIQNVLDNQKKIHNPNWITPEAVVDIYCGDTHPDRKNICRLQTNPRDPKGPKVTAFGSSWVERGYFFNTYNMVLCPRFFKEKQSLESLLKDIKDGKEDGENPNTYKKAWGHTIYHELTHLDPVIAQNEVWDPAYYGCPVAKLANQNGCAYNPVSWHPPKWDEKRHGSAHSLINGDSWAFFASGSYFQKALELKVPARPLNDCGIFSGSSFDNYTWFDPDTMAADGVRQATVDRKNGFDAKEPPQVAKENTPPEDPPTPSLPYKAADLPKGLATPFSDVDAYFADYTPGTTKPTATNPNPEQEPPPPPTDPEVEQPPPEPDMDSEACRGCGDNLGASDCGPDENQCLVDQCKNDDKCRECNWDCDQYANS